MRKLCVLWSARPDGKAIAHAWASSVAFRELMSVRLSSSGLVRLVSARSDRVEGRSGSEMCGDDQQTRLVHDRLQQTFEVEAEGS